MRLSAANREFEVFASSDLISCLGTESNEQKSFIKINSKIYKDFRVIIIIVFEWLTDKS